MACEIYILTCPIGAEGDECTFEIDCCGGQTINYTMLPDSMIEACVNPQGTVTATSLSGSVSNTFDPCSSDCGDIPVVPTRTPTPIQVRHLAQHQVRLLDCRRLLQQKHLH